MYICTYVHMYMRTCVPRVRCKKHESHARHNVATDVYIVRFHTYYPQPLRRSQRQQFTAPALSLCVLMMPQTGTTPRSGKGRGNGFPQAATASGKGRGSASPRQWSARDWQDWWSNWPGSSWWSSSSAAAASSNSTWGKGSPAATAGAAPVATAGAWGGYRANVAQMELPAASPPGESHQRRTSKKQQLKNIVRSIWNQLTNEYKLCCANKDSFDVHVWAINNISAESYAEAIAAKN